MAAQATSSKMSPKRPTVDYNTKNMYSTISNFNPVKRSPKKQAVHENTLPVNFNSTMPPVRRSPRSNVMNIDRSA